MILTADADRWLTALQFVEAVRLECKTVNLPEPDSVSFQEYPTAPRVSIAYGCYVVMIHLPRGIPLEIAAHHLVTAYASRASDPLPDDPPTFSVQMGSVRSQKWKEKSHI